MKMHGAGLGAQNSGMPSSCDNMGDFLFGRNDSQFNFKVKFN